MKKIISLFIITGIVLLFACGQSKDTKQKKLDSLKADSIARVHQKRCDSLKYDSIDKADSAHQVEFNLQFLKNVMLKMKQ